MTAVHPLWASGVQLPEGFYMWSKGAPDVIEAGIDNGAGLLRGIDRDGDRVVGRRL